MIAMGLDELLLRLILFPYFFVLLIGVMVAIATGGRYCMWALELQRPGYRRRCRCDHDDDSEWL